ncbi:MAG: hypothetical protein Q7J98_08235 [Kiritimatiellia bacterium]|nr:hypothetical protein [Kiritimatiellia bacterium]
MRSMHLLLFLILVPCLCGGAIQKRRINAEFTEKAPVIDGKLDENCWAKTAASGGFIKTGTTELAQEETEAWILYDDANLYFGFKCKEPEMAKVRDAKARNSAEFKYGEGETVETFLDPGDTDETFLQFLINSNGTGLMLPATKDMTHLGGELPWKYAVFLGDDFFSVEIAVPFAVLHLKPGVANTWGVNFCRARMIGGKEHSQKYSSWQRVRSAFNRADGFGDMIINANFSPFAFDVQTAAFAIPGAPWNFNVKNRTGEKRDVRLNVDIIPCAGLPRNINADFSIENNKEIQIPFGCFGKADYGALVKIALIERQSGQQLFFGTVQSKDETPVWPPSAESKKMFYKNDALIDLFDSDKLEGWKFGAAYWQNDKGNGIPKEENPANFKLELEKNNKYFYGGGGALRLVFPSACFTNHPHAYGLLSKPFDSKNMTNANALVFNIYTAAGAGRLGITLFNNSTWKALHAHATVFLDRPGFTQVVINKNDMRSKDKNIDDLWKEMNLIQFACFGDFEIYLSDLRITKSNKIEKLSAQMLSDKTDGYDEDIPTIDVTAALPRKQK